MRTGVPNTRFYLPLCQVLVCWENKRLVYQELPVATFVLAAGR